MSKAHKFQAVKLSSPIEDKEGVVVVVIMC